MKKTILAALAASVLATGAAQAAGFDGFYVGAGVTSNTADSKITTNTGTSFNMGEGARQMGFGVNAGYGKTFGQFYLAGEAAYAINQGETGSTIVSGANYSGKAKSIKSLSIIPGFLATTDLLIYARLGKGNVDTEETLSNSTTSISASGDIDVITKGIGFEYSISKNMAVRAEFNVSNGDKTNDSGTKSEVSANSLAAGIQYRF